MHYSNTHEFEFSKLLINSQLGQRYLLLYCLLMLLFYINYLFLFDLLQCLRLGQFNSFGYLFYIGQYSYF